MDKNKEEKDKREFRQSAMEGHGLRTWLGGLKAGDEVGIFGFHGRKLIRKSTVRKITMADRIRLSDRTLFRRDGTIVGGGAQYGDLVIRPVPEEK